MCFYQGKKKPAYVSQQHQKVLDGIGGEPQTDTVCLGENGKERGEGREGVFTAAFAFDIFCGEPGGDRAGLPVEPRPAGGVVARRRASPWLGLDQWKAGRNTREGQKS